MDDDRHNGRGRKPLPGLFQSWYEAGGSVIIFLIASFLAAPLIGIWAGIAYEFFKKGWDLIQ